MTEILFQIIRIVISRLHSDLIILRVYQYFTFTSMQQPSFMEQTFSMEQTTVCKKVGQVK